MAAPAIEFEQLEEYSEESIVKLAPAIGRRGGIAIAKADNGALMIVGRNAYASSIGLSVKVLDPGRLIISFWDNIAVVAGAEITFIRDALMYEYGHVWDKLGRGHPADEPDLYHSVRRTALMYIARQVRTLEHGGTVVIVGDVERCQASIRSMAFGIANHEGSLYHAIKSQMKEYEEGTSDGATGWYTEAMAIQVAQLTQIDGAVLLNRELGLIGFGAKFKPAGNDSPQKVFLVDPLEHDKSSAFIDVNALKTGTRHQSAIQFVFDNPDALVIVVSQDGSVTALVWDEWKPGSHAVIAYGRLELVLF